MTGLMDFKVFIINCWHIKMKFRFTFFQKCLENLRITIANKILLKQMWSVLYESN